MEIAAAVIGALVASVLAALGVLAYRHPEQFKRKSPVVAWGLIAAMAAGAIWQIAAFTTALTFLPDVGAEKVVAGFYRVALPPWTVLGLLAIVTILIALAVLPSWFLDDRPKDENDHLDK